MREARIGLNLSWSSLLISPFSAKISENAKSMRNCAVGWNFETIFTSLCRGKAVKEKFFAMRNFLCLDKASSIRCLFFREFL